MLPSVPTQFRQTYEIIINHRLMHHILTLQRFFKRRSLNNWLVTQTPGNLDWETRKFVAVSRIDD